MIQFLITICPGSRETFSYDEEEIVLEPPAIGKKIIEFFPILFPIAYLCEINA